MASILRNLGHSTKDAMVGFCFPAFVVYVFAMAQLDSVFRVYCHILSNGDLRHSMSILVDLGRGARCDRIRGI